LASAQLQFIVASPVIVMPHAKAGRIKLIATTGAKRDPFLPELPTIGDVLPGFEITTWVGFAAPAKTPAVIVNRLHAEIVAALQSSEVRELLARQGVTAHAESSAEFTAFIKVDRERIARVGRQAGITLD
jgi:tripartite-type tricarboxylate transporter receptor subunit TctC